MERVNYGIFKDTMPQFFLVVGRVATSEILVKEVPNSIFGEGFVGFLGTLMSPVLPRPSNSVTISTNTSDHFRSS